jgi:hypothetical protein
MQERKEGRKDGWMNGWMDEVWTENFLLHLFFIVFLSPLANHRLWLAIY